MKILLPDCPLIKNAKAFFKAKSVVYIELFEAPVEVAPSGLKLITIYATPGTLYRYFKKGYLLPVNNETGYQPLILWHKPLQEIIDSQRVFDFSAWDPQKDKIAITEDEIILRFMPRITLSEISKRNEPGKN